MYTPFFLNFIMILSGRIKRDFIRFPLFIGIFRYIPGFLCVYFYSFFIKHYNRELPNNPGCLQTDFT